MLVSPTEIIEASMISRRELLLLVALPSALRGAISEEIRDVFALVASALAEGNPANLMEQFDTAMPEYRDLRSSLEALTAHAWVASSIRVDSEQGDEKSYSVELDWLMEIRPRGFRAQVERRRETVRCTLRKRRRRWLITAIGPISFFAPPDMSRREA
jgi:hypothetical protein